MIYLFIVQESNNFFTYVIPLSNFCTIQSIVKLQGYYYGAIVTHARTLDFSSLQVVLKAPFDRNYVKNGGSSNYNFQASSLLARLQDFGFVNNGFNQNRDTALQHVLSL